MTDTKVNRVLEAARDTDRIIQAYGIRDCSEVRVAVERQRSAIDALDAPQERYAARQFLENRWHVIDGGRIIGYSESQEHAEQIAAALNAHAAREGK